MKEHLLIADTAPAFADATLRLLDDPALRRRLGEAGRELLLDRFTWPVAWRALESRRDLDVGRTPWSAADALVGLLSPSDALHTVAPLYRLCFKEARHNGARDNRISATAR